jgi:hypothetical protein
LVAHDHVSDLLPFAGPGGLSIGSHTRWDRAALQEQTKTMTFPMLDQMACEDTATMVRGAVHVAGTYPEGTTVITRCQSVAAHQSDS